MRVAGMFRATVVAIVVGPGAVLTMGGASATESVTPLPQAQPSAGKYCYMEMVPESPGSRDLVTASTTCSDEPQSGTVLPKSTRSASQAAHTLLVTLFSEQDYNGRYTTLGGRFGTCDRAGYRFVDLEYANVGVIPGITSYKLNGACYYSTIWTGKNFTGLQKGFSTQNVRYVGTPHNDKVLSMRVGSR